MSNVWHKYQLCAIMAALMGSLFGAKTNAAIVTLEAGTGNHVYTFALASSPNSDNLNCCGQINDDLTVGILDNQSFTGRGFLRFPNVSSVGATPITNATFRIARESFQASASPELWRLTSAFNPADVATGFPGSASNAGLFSTSATLLGSIPAGANGAYVDVDVTAIVQAWQASSYTNAFGFGIRNALEANPGGGASSQTIFHSPAAAANLVPQLVITTVPEPSSLALLLLGSVFLWYRSRKRSF